MKKAKRVTKPVRRKPIKKNTSKPPKRKLVEPIYIRDLVQTCLESFNMARMAIERGKGIFNESSKMNQYLTNPDRYEPPTVDLPGGGYLPPPTNTILDDTVREHYFGVNDPLLPLAKLANEASASLEQASKDLGFNVLNKDYNKFTHDQQSEVVADIDTLNRVTMGLAEMMTDVGDLLNGLAEERKDMLVYDVLHAYYLKNDLVALDRTEVHDDNTSDILSES